MALITEFLISDLVCGEIPVDVLVLVLEEIVCSDSLFLLFCESFDVEPMFACLVGYTQVLL